MPKRKTGYLRGLSRAAYNALQRYNRLAREDGMQALAPGKVKKEAKDKGMSAYDYIRKQEETNIAPRATKKEEAMIRKLRSIERRAGKVPTSTAAIRRSIAAAKAKKPRKGARKRNAKDILSQLETKALDIVDPSSVKWLHERKSLHLKSGLVTEMIRPPNQEHMRGAHGGLGRSLRSNSG